ncbi:hypothetical protein CU098_009774, partial [Rhizopus stolonifer]
MNLELLDPLGHEYPQLIEETLEDGYVLKCKFNKRGTLLAAGCLDGRCIIWDFDTKGVSRNLVGHIKPITNISNRFIAVLHHDSPVIVDILGKDIVKTVLPTEPETREERHS